MTTEDDTGPGATLVRSGEDSESVALEDITTIGRSAGNTLTIGDDELVSRNHALIRRDADDYVLVDLGSANGTFVNDRPISNPTILKDNDALKFGDTVFSFQDVRRRRASQKAVGNKSTRRFFAGVNIAVLVSDVRNYTTLSERIAADRLSALLSDWFRSAGQCIDKHGGIIEKFRGDSLMAYWVAGEDDATEHVTSAIETARAMVGASRAYDERIAEFDPGGRFAIGCGIHTGDAVLGNIGADARRDFTTLGDCVNVTFRIEGLCSKLDREILVSGEARRLVPVDLEFEDLGEHALKGKAEPIQLFAL